MGLSVELEKRLGAVHLEVRFQTGEGPLALLGMIERIRLGF